MTTDTYESYAIMDLAAGGEMFEYIQKRGAYSEKDAQEGESLLGC